MFNINSVIEDIKVYAKSWDASNTRINQFIGTGEIDYLAFTFLIFIFMMARIYR